MPTTCMRATCTVNRSTLWPTSASRKRRWQRAAVARINPDRARRDRTRPASTPTMPLPLVRAHDVVVDCSDNFRTKFLINDAAVLARRPAVFASVYQYEGQLQVYEPRRPMPAFAVSGPMRPRDGVVGNCAEAGVLGPGAGAFGALQALLTLKILLRHAGSARRRAAAPGFHELQQHPKLKAPRRAECPAPELRTHPRADPRRDRTSKITPPLARRPRASGTSSSSMSERAEEFAAKPTRSRHIPMASLLADSGLLESGRRLPSAVRLRQAQPRRRTGAAQARLRGALAGRRFAGDAPER